MLLSVRSDIEVQSCLHKAVTEHLHNRQALKDSGGDSVLLYLCFIKASVDVSSPAALTERGDALFCSNMGVITPPTGCVGVQEITAKRSKDIGCSAWSNCRRGDLVTRLQPKPTLTGEGGGGGGPANLHSERRRRKEKQKSRTKRKVLLSVAQLRDLSMCHGCDE
ncbi:hypothetical protein F2P81_021295 [Scophthalmus maximus]|uniref:Uncharacterized protein n=1 Tax=Scophthalmus maximus TaxID=52904 RepID=A0A6A4S314_SCOMX|nr:hypothetical protein F2P81_021295 [Scophthalmus maximus]